MSAASWLRVVRAGMLKNWRLTITYPSWAINRLVGPIVSVSISMVTYLALVPQADIRSAFVRSGNGPDFAAFLILGQTIFSFFSTLNFRGGMSIQRERWQGTLELVMLAPTSRVAFILGETLYGLLDGGWTIILGLIVTTLAYRARFHVADPLLAATVVALTLSAMVALSLFFAGFYVLTRSAGPLSNAIQAPVRFLTGTSFPVSALPAALQAVGLAIPMTYGAFATRAVFAGSATWGSLAGTLVALLAFTAAFWVAGVLLIHHMERVAKQRGTLHHF